MSFLDVLARLTKNVGRGALDVFTLGGNELGHHFGGDAYKKFMNPVETGFGANLEAGATGGSAIQGLGMLGAGGSMSPYMPASTPNMGAAGSTLGPGGMLSSLNPMGTSMGPQAAGGPSSLATAFKLMRMMPQGGGQQQDGGAQQRQNQEMQMRLIYQMFPNLKPGSPLGTGGI